MCWWVPRDKYTTNAGCPGLDVLRFHADFAVAELAVASGLLLVASLRLRLGADLQMEALPILYTLRSGLPAAYGPGTKE
jgi:hypothetical protein